MIFGGAVEVDSLLVHHTHDGLDRDIIMSNVFALILDLEPETSRKGHGSALGVFFERKLRKKRLTCWQRPGSACRWFRTLYGKTTGGKRKRRFRSARWDIDGSRLEQEEGRLTRTRMAVWTEVAKGRKFVSV